MLKTISVLCFSVLISLFGFGVAQTVVSRQGNALKRLARQTEPATPIQENVMPEKQRKHSRIFRGYGAATQGRRLRDLVAERGDVDVMIGADEVPTPPSFDLDRYLRGLTCKADAVVVATLRSKSSHLIEEGTFVFTDYELAVSQVLKNNAAAPLQPGALVTFTSPGGAVLLRGHIVRALDSRNEPLEAGYDYLLYLQFIPETQSYKSFSDSLNGDTFQLRGDTVVQASSKPLPLGGRGAAPAAPFLSKVRAAAEQTCHR